jgi:hypothetical protein
MNELAKQESNVVAMPQASNLLEAISRAASDPAMDVGKMERLFAMHQEMVRMQAESAFNDAIVECQREVGRVASNAENSQTRSRYATYAALDKALRPIYSKHGISISYDTAESEKPDTIIVLAYASKGAYTRTYRASMPCDGKGAKGGDVMTKTHAMGAAISYGSRYLLKAIFNIAIGEEDKDGNDVTAELLPENRKVDFLTAIESVSKEGIDALWAKICNATPTDANSRDELRIALAARKKALK